MALWIVRLPGQEAPAGKGVSLYCWTGDCATGKIGARGGLVKRKSKAPPCLAKNRRDKDGAPTDVAYWAGFTGAAGVAGVSAVTSGVMGLIFTVASIFSRRSKTLSRSTCLIKPSCDATVVTLRANS